MSNQILDPVDELLEDVLSTSNSKLVVHNDEFNTFDHVIQTLIDVCGHSSHQAEQCTYIIHFKGKCTVKEGYFDDLKPMKDAISDRGIGVTIED